MCREAWLLSDTDAEELFGVAMRSGSEEWEPNWSEEVLARGATSQEILDEWRPECWFREDQQEREEAHDEEHEEAREQVRLIHRALLGEETHDVALEETGLMTPIKKKGGRHVDVVAVAVVTGIGKKKKQRGRSDSDAPPKKKKEFLPADAKAFLREWCIENIDNPYPTEAEKLDVCIQTNLTLTQVNNWFTNWRKRFWKLEIAARLPVEID